MDLKSQQAFLCLADTLHFARAASRLHISPPTLSRRIRQLEDELGVTLLIRDQRGVELTPAGMAFHAYAQKSVVQWEEFQEAIQPGNAELFGELSLFCSVTASYRLLDSLLPRFRQRHPKIEIRMHTGDQAESIDRVLSSREDLAIAANPVLDGDERLPERLEFLSITSTELVFVAPRQKTAFSSQLQNPLQALPELPFIFPETGVTRRAIEQWFLQQRIKPSVYSEVAGHEAIVAMVALGMGVAVVPELVLANSPVMNQVRRLPLDKGLKPLDVGLCCLSRRLSNPLLGAFWQTAVDAFASPVD